jgi:5-methyltetrahydrofolate corrinoid/iron sulfur protein methyltransferase
MESILAVKNRIWYAKIPFWTGNDSMKLIADNLRITKTDIWNALKALDPGPVQELVKQCAAKGAYAVDVNTGPLGKLPEEGMRFFIRAVEGVTNLPLLIDTSNPRAMRAGLEVADNRAIINGFSLEPGKLEKILPLAKEFDADIVGFLLYPDSRVPRDEAQRFEIALELFEQAEAAGVAKERIIIDPVVPPLAWENGIVQARAVLNVIRTLPDLLGFPVQTIAGISNLTTGAMDKRKKALVEQSYVSMLAAAGLDYALLNMFNRETVAAARVAGILSKEDLFSWGMVPG